MNIQPNPDGTCSRECEQFTPLTDANGDYCRACEFHIFLDREEICPIAYKILEDVARAVDKEKKEKGYLPTHLCDALSRVTWLDWSNDDR